ncbi:hypothetical protein [Salsuginibacillus kocurii]|uniref:hypothetical protein n=1 Tax=Salsuginibacillus kocurii TaxID=427078 RepID=UPI0003697479|nr:hypothetical protein [Salsuginibacillus kocurii]
MKHDRIQDFRTQTSDLVEAAYLAGSSPFVTNVDIKHMHCYLLGAFDQVNPLVQTVQDYINGRASEYKYSPLEMYYNYYQPETIGEALGVVVEEEDDVLTRSPFNAPPPPPWDGRPVLKQWEKSKKQESQQLKKPSQEKTTSKGSGQLYYGPVGEEFGARTYKRLIRAADSIQEKGYEPATENSFLKGCILSAGSEQRVWIIHSKHRLAALAALEYKTIPVLFGRKNFPVIIRREEVASWPLVRRRLYTKEQALKVFDRFFTEELSITSIH